MSRVRTFLWRALLSDTVLKAIHLTKVIRGRTIVNGVSFEVRHSEIFGFLGPNGAGKTTTIRMLVGLIRPTAGSVEICGHDVRRQFEQAMRCVGCIVETPDLYKFMSGRENLEHFARMCGGVDAARIEEVATLVSLEHRLDDKVRTYSLGMRQRLGIAQALLARPRLLILDEPANGLDPAGIREIRELLRTLADRQKLAVLISSHLLAEIEMICDRIAIIHRGEIITEGPVRDLVAVSSQFSFDVSDALRAKALLAAGGMESSVDGARLTVTLDRAEIPRIVRQMTEEGIDIFAVERRQQTLEELFLETTGHASVD